MAFLAVAMLLLFLSTGPCEHARHRERGPSICALARSAAQIFMIHLFGDMWSPEIIGACRNHWHSLRKAVLILPVALVICAALWLVLARVILAEPRGKNHPFEPLRAGRRVIFRFTSRQARG